MHFVLVQLKWSLVHINVAVALREQVELVIILHRQKGVTIKNKLKRQFVATVNPRISLLRAYLFLYFWRGAYSRGALPETCHMKR